jgi:hypothetical protein
MTRSVLAPLCSLALTCSLLLLAVPDAQAQSRQGQRAPTQQRAVPGQGHAPPGSQGPAATRPSNPSSSLGQSPSGANTPGGTQTPGQAQTNSGPNTPSDPNQTPLGGAEWLAAAGAAYALNRLRKDEDGEDEESDDEMP